MSSSASSRRGAAETTRWFDRWIFDSYPVSAEQLGLYRIAYASFVLFVIGVPRYTWIAEFPDAFFHPPPSVASLASGFPPPIVLHLFGFLLVALLLALLFGVRTRVVSIGIAIVGITADSFHYSFGKIDHVRHLLFLLPLVMSFSNWGAAYAWDARRNVEHRVAGVHGWPICAMSLLLGFAMFTAGFAKATGGWPDLATSAVEQHVFFRFSGSGSPPLLAGFFLGLENRLLWESFDWLTMAFEMGFLVAVLRPSWFRFFTVSAVGFHTMTLLLLDIAFLPHLIVYLLFSTPLLRLDAARLAPLARFTTLPSAIVFSAAVLLVYGLGLPTTLPEAARFVSSRLSEVPASLPSLVILGLALSVAGVIALRR